MKKVIRVLASGVVAASLFSGVASAQTITNTGPGSTNTVTNNTSRSTKIVCINDVNVKADNKQSANSGNATNSGNTSSGGAQSGNASNSNNTNVAVNGGCAAGTKPVAAGSPEAKTAKGGVAPAGQGATALKAQTKVNAEGNAVDAQGVVLPATGVDENVKTAGIAVASLAGVAGAAAAATGFYRRRVLN